MQRIWYLPLFILTAALGFTTIHYAIPSDEASITVEELCGADRLAAVEPPNMASSHTELYNHPKPSVPMIRIRINEKGLRDEPFSETKPRNLTRILVLGDSFTFGYGLNESERYTEKLEQRLDAQLQTDIQVINAGRRQAGMKDYYQLLYHKGRFYNPDIVVIAFSWQDAISREQKKNWTETARKRHNIASKEYILSSSSALKTVSRIRLEFFRNLSWTASDIWRYGKLIQHLAEQAGFKAIFFRIQPDHRRALNEFMYTPLHVGSKQYDAAFNAWTTECDIDLVSAPDSIHSPPNMIPNDGHYNPKGNTILARTLASHLSTTLNRTIPPTE